MKFHARPTLSILHAMTWWKSRRGLPTINPGQILSNLVFLINVIIFPSNLGVVTTIPEPKIPCRGPSFESESASIEAVMESDHSLQKLKKHVTAW
jgi:hypothetical protein